MEKYCYKCQSTKSVELFGKRTREKDGLRQECKECFKKFTKAKYKKTANYRKAHTRNMSRKYHKDPIFRAERIAYFKERRRLFPERDKASRKVKKAIVAGKLVRLPCTKCGNPKSHGHHEDYSKPLEVVWLCASCHMRMHEARRVGSFHDLNA